MSTQGKRLYVVGQGSRLVLEQDIDLSCGILEQSGLASTNRFLDLGAAKHKQNTRSIADYKIFRLHSVKLRKGRA